MAESGAKMTTPLSARAVSLPWQWQVRRSGLGCMHADDLRLIQQCSLCMSLRSLGMETCQLITRLSLLRRCPACEHVGEGCWQGGWGRQAPSENHISGTGISAARASLCSVTR